MPTLRSATRTVTVRGACAPGSRFPLTHEELVTVCGRRPEANLTSASAPSSRRFICVAAKPATRASAMITGLTDSGGPECRAVEARHGGSVGYGRVTGRTG
jgi:hypothetical protein